MIKFYYCIDLYKKKLYGPVGFFIIPECLTKTLPLHEFCCKVHSLLNPSYTLIHRFNNIQVKLTAGITTCVGILLHGHWKMRINRNCIYILEIFQLNLEPKILFKHYRVHAHVHIHLRKNTNQKRSPWGGGSKMSTDGIVVN